LIQEVGMVLGLSARMIPVLVKQHNAACSYARSSAIVLRSVHEALVVHTRWTDWRL
jgi:hypothetical protein